MNKLNGIIKNIQKSGSIILVDINVDNHIFSAMLIASIEESSWIKTGNNVGVVFKETEVSLAKELSGHISLRNRIPCTVNDIIKGELLCKITMDFMGHSIISVITSRSADALNILIGDKVEALIKANEVSLIKI